MEIITNPMKVPTTHPNANLRSEQDVAPNGVLLSIFICFSFLWLP